MTKIDTPAKQATQLNTDDYNMAIPYDHLKTNYRHMKKIMNKEMENYFFPIELRKISTVISLYN